MASSPEPCSITWQPLDILSPAPIVHKPFALLILNQALKLPIHLYRQLWANASFIIAADGGANRLYTLNTENNTSLSLNVVIGDLDSLFPPVRKLWEEKGIPVIHDPDQYSTDFTKAVKYIKSEEERKGVDIVVLGGLGGRVDQGLSVLHHLFLFQEDERYGEGRMYLLSSEAITFVLKTGKHSIKAKERWTGIGGRQVGSGSGVHEKGEGKGGRGKGEVAFRKHVGILPLKGASVITTQGLEWDVEHWRTVFGGEVSTSNHVKEEIVQVETSEDVLFTIDLDFESGGG